MPDLTTEEARLEKIVAALKTIATNTEGGGGGGGGGFDTITQIDDSIYIPNGYIEWSAQQTNLGLSDKILYVG